MASSSDGNTHLSMDALESAVRSAEPCAVLLAPWLLQKLIAYEHGPSVNVFVLPRTRAHLMARERFLEITQKEELPLDSPPPASERLILLARPEADVLSSTGAPDLLLQYWRLLFRTRARDAVQNAIASEADPRTAVQRRIERLSRPAFNEARFVLQRERYVSTGANDAEVYAEFAAFFLEMTFFAPEPLAWFFPAVVDRAAALAILAHDVDGEMLLKATRPPGAAEPQNGAAVAPPAAARPASKRARRDLAHQKALLERAARADAVGNDVRAAIFRMRVYRASGLAGPPRDNLAAVYADALKDLDQLVGRLKAALSLDDSRARQWRAWLVALLENAAGGWWNAEGRLLYDLQKVCVYHEREIYSVNVVDYLIDLGKRPLRRPQPGQRLVLTLKSLRSALRRTARARLSPHGRRELQRLLHLAIDDVERRLRDFLCPGVTAALRDGGLEPQTAVETVAHAKLTEELLDEIVENGYLTFPGVRDAVSGNQMKLNDLSRTRDFTRGDQLLRIDQELEENLDYVYRRGEVYLRLFHRLSSLFFATHVGRLITRFLILPFGGAFLILEALDHSAGIVINKLLLHPAIDPATGKAHHVAVFNHWWLLILLGLFLFGVIDIPPFRRAVAQGFKRFFRAVRAVLFDFPKWLATNPLVQAFFASQFARLFFRYVFKPLLAALFVYVFLPDTVSDKKKMFTLAGVFLIVNVLLNSRAGRALEQAILHSLRTTLARFTWDILVAIVRFIVQIFQRLLEAVDRLLYAVDELLRFRAGQKKSTVVIKAVLGVFWFYIAYITRFVINLLIEPQINPIKHFPVVTVSHKLLFPTIPYLGGVFVTFGIDRAAALAYATGIIWCIPGIFGFLAWEFKENWKLYKANRSRNLKPVRAGSHGETVAQFLRPGFHSGTIPKLFHKLRKAQLKSAAPLSSTHKHVEALHHVAESLRAFLEREFLALLNRHPLFAESPITLKGIRLATTMIRVELSQGTELLVLTFEQRAAWILAAIEQAGWLDRLSPPQSQHFWSALTGLYKLAGTDLVQHQIQYFFPHETRFDFRKDDLIVWPTPDFAVEAVYKLTSDGPLAPTFATAPQDVRLPTLQPSQILFRQVPLSREQWNQLWQPG